MDFDDRRTQVMLFDRMLLQQCYDGDDDDNADYFIERGK